MFWSDRGTNGQTDGQANERDTESNENMDTCSDVENINFLLIMMHSRELRQ